jgi:hypothetical protein
MSAGVAAADPRLDALHDLRVGRQRRKPTCQHLNVNQACIGERCGKRVVLVSASSQLCQDTVMRLEAQATARGGSRRFAAPWSRPARHGPSGNSPLPLASKPRHRSQTSSWRRAQPLLRRVCSCGRPRFTYRAAPRSPSAWQGSARPVSEPLRRQRRQRDSARLRV